MSRYPKRRRVLGALRAPAMHHYSHINLAQIASLSDGERIFLLGRYHRHLQGAVLSQQGMTIDLIGEPFNWLPSDDAVIEVWGVLWQGQQPRLWVHDARPVGATRSPQLTPERIVGELIVIQARVMQFGQQWLAVTVDRQSYLLVGSPLTEHLQLIRGEVTGLHPPVLRVLGSVPIEETPP